MEVDLAPHRGYVYCDFCPVSQRWRLTHTGTLSSVDLPDGGEWVLAYDADGFAYASDELNASTCEVDVDDLLSSQLAQLPDGRLMVLGPLEGGTRSRDWLEALLTEFDRGTFSMRIGPTSQHHAFDIVIFRRPRGGYRIFFSLVALYRSLGFSMFHNVASRWAWQVLAGLEKRMASHLGGQVLRSQPYRADASEQQGSLSDRCLPFHSVSSAALVIFLSEWCGASTRTGGLKDDKHRLSCNYMLQSLVQSVCSQAEHRILIFVDEAFQHRWPRPPCGERMIELVVKDCVIDFGPLRRFCIASDHPDCVRWRLLIDQNLADQVDYTGALVRLASDPQAKSLGGQLGLWLARFVEDRFFGLSLGAEDRGIKRVETRAPATLYHMSSELARFVNKTATICEAMAPIRFLSITTGKSNVGGLPLQNSFMNVNSSQFVFPAIAQVDRDFESAVAGSDEEGVVANQGGRKRARDGEGPPAPQSKRAAIQRQRQWLGRSVTGAESAAWRPRLPPRRSAFRWLLGIENQIRMHTGLPGLVHFRPLALGDDLGTASDVLRWPSLTLAMDRGADGVSGCHYLQRRLALNLDEIWDASHDSWRDFLRCIRECDLLPFWFLFLVCCNCLSGPWLEASRQNALIEAMDACWRTFTPSECPLYDELVNSMAWEAGQPNDMTSGGQTAHWADLGKDEIWRKRPYKVNMNRFWHGVQEGWNFAASWSKYRFDFTFLALETNALDQTKLKNIVFRESANQATKGQENAAEENALKTKINALAASVVFLSEYGRLKKLRMILTISHLVELWFRQQAHESAPSMRTLGGSSARSWATSCCM